VVEERSQSEFNMAVSYLNRLNALFYAVIDARLSLDAHAWFYALAAIEGELSTEMTDKELDDFEEVEQAINQLLVKNAQGNARTGRQEIETPLYLALRSYELSLRKVLKGAGLQNKMVQGAEQFFK
jgi:hypothetical protein